MKKKYLPSIIKQAEIIEKLLVDFFVEYNIKNRQHAKNIICDELVNSFIEGTLDDTNHFFETKIDRVLKKIYADNFLHRFVAEGIIHDDNDPVLDPHLTEKSKEILKNMKNETKHEH